MRAVREEMKDEKKDGLTGPGAALKGRMRERFQVSGSPMDLRTRGL